MLGRSEVCWDARLGVHPPSRDRIAGDQDLVAVDADDPGLQHGGPVVAITGCYGGGEISADLAQLAPHRPFSDLPADPVVMVGLRPGRAGVLPAQGCEQPVLSRLSCHRASLL
jgi:hypothetical protein